MTGAANLAGRFIFCLVLIATLHVTFSITSAAGDERVVLFEIRAFDLSGNSIFPADKLQEAVKPFIGPGKTAADVEKARDALEKFYHGAGYPAVMVNIPEQTLQGGVVKLQIIESRIGRVRITGNRYFTMEKVMKDLPSLAPGEMLYLPNVQKEIGRLNRSQDFKINPVMTPGIELGTIDVELKVEDRLPLHGSLELNNRASHDTRNLRLNAMLRYDNLWQKEHSVSVQYQTAPQNANEVEMLGASYVLPAPWDPDNLLAFYGLWSDSETAFGEGFKVAGKGKIFGMRYVVSLPPYKLYAHNINLGIDYKNFDEAVGYTTGEGETTSTPISYLPLSFSYSASLPDEWGGTTQFSGGLNMSFRGVGSREEEFERKRYKGKANYLYATAGIQRTQKLPWGMSIFVKLDGQLSDQPLIANEEYSAGGMESVRGYKESEVLGDDALHGTVEVGLPDPFAKTRIGKWFQMTPFLFYDMAELSIKEPLSSQDRSMRLEGAGVGLRGSIMKNLEYEFDWAVAMENTDRIKRNDQRSYFKVKALF